VWSLKDPAGYPKKLPSKEKESDKFFGLLCLQKGRSFLDKRRTKDNG
jgi:hypothetical protein